jgi:hypothetical protein
MYSVYASPVQTPFPASPMHYSYSISSPSKLDLSPSIAYSTASPAATTPTASPNISFPAAKAVAAPVKWEVVDGRVAVAVKLLPTPDPVAETPPVPTTTVECPGAVVMVAKETAEETALAPELSIIVMPGRAEDETVAAEVMAMVVAAATELAIAVDTAAFGP